MAIDYQELIKAEIFEKEWNPQDKVLSVVARKRHGISKAGDKKKGAVLIALKFMLRKGLIKKAVDEDGNIFWGKRSAGEESVIFWKKTKIALEVEELTKLSVARKNIAQLEGILQDKFSDIFEKSYKTGWEKYINATTYEKLKDQYRAANKKDWVASGSPRDLFAVAGIKDFSYLIADKENRDLYLKMFPDRFILGAKLSDLGEYRNRIQHNEQLSKEEYIYFNITAQLIMDKLSQ